MANFDHSEINYSKPILGVMATTREVDGEIAAHIIMNRDFYYDHPDEINLRALQDSCLHGVPQSWTEIQPGIFVDNREHPLYLAKIRRDRSMEASTHPEQATGWLDFRHEFQIAHKVVDAVLSSAVQNQIKNMGFDHIIPVIPIFGVDVEKTKEKIVIYPYVEGTPIEQFGDHPLMQKNKGKFTELSALINKGLSKLHIRAVDSTVRQFIINPEKRTIYLIDMEGYFIDPSVR